MRNTGRVCRALVVAGTLETVRRKDLYVVVVLTALMIVGAGALGFFGVHGLEVFLRDVTFTAIGLFSAILAVVLASRQLPEEIQRRTIYPLMARPITRWQLLLGKWLTASLMSVLGFLMLAAAARVLLLVYHVPVGTIFWQYVLLKSLGLVWLCGMTVGLSVYMTPAATIAVALILSLGSAAFTRFTLLYHAQTGLGLVWLNTLYGLLPHYDLFDLGQKVTYDWPPVQVWVLGALVGYSVLGSLLWLSFGWLKFRRATI
jgi:ABC-type transport system involved in multi-copper enzyme maturation permease subunit